MGRQQVAPYFYSVANQNGGKDRYILSIRDRSKSSGYKKKGKLASKPKNFTTITLNRIPLF